MTAIANESALFLLVHSVHRRCPYRIGTIDDGMAYSYSPNEQYMRRGRDTAPSCSPLRWPPPPATTDALSSPLLLPWRLPLHAATRDSRHSVPPPTAPSCRRSALSSAHCGGQPLPATTTDARSPLLFCWHGDCPFMQPPAVAAIPCHHRLRFHLAALLARAPARHPNTQLRSCLVSSTA